MGRFASAVYSHREHLFYSKEGSTTVIRQNAKNALAQDLDDMLDAIDDDFDAADKKAYEWVKARD